MNQINTLFFSISDGFLYYNNARFDNPLDCLLACQDYHTRKFQVENWEITKEIKENIRHNNKQFENLKRGDLVTFKRWWLDVEDELLFGGGLYPKFAVNDYKQAM